MSVRLSVDIGGTFTDVALQSDDAGHSQLTTTKVLTTYDDPANAVLSGARDVLTQAGVSACDVSLVLHGTTLATNALIERQGARTALLTTSGHRDVLEMAFENRFEQYDVNIDRPQPLVPRNWRIGIEERIAADGRVLVELNEQQVLAGVQQLVDEGVEALAVCYLHSYAHGEHERRTGALLDAHFPDLSVTLSQDVCPEIREYERVSTTVANAYVKPLMSRYLNSLSHQLQAQEITCPVMLMTSGGGLTTLETAARFPIRLVESGPAGGAILAADLARQHELSQVLSFDMGGTTAKVCLIEDGEPLHSRAFEVDRSYRFKKGSGLPVRIPVIEMVEIGAGGGSVAHVDALSRLIVGPESAGSEPGPACYGLGGERATVTDADVVLGKLVPELFAGGRLQLDSAAAAAAIARDVAAPLLETTPLAAFAVAEIVEENMASAARAHAAEWGLGLNGRCMIAFGGAAPLHAAALARKLKIDQVLIPQGAGVGSALGFLLAPVSFEVVRSHFTTLQQLDCNVIAEMLGQMRAEAGLVLDAAGVTSGRAETCQAYMRYAGQGYEIAVKIPVDIFTADSSAAHAEFLRAGFEEAYARLYARTIPGMPIEVLSWTLALSATVPQSDAATLSESPASGQSGRPAMDALLDDITDDITDGATLRYFDGLHEVPLPVVPRERILVGQQLAGPVLVVEAQTSVLVPAKMQVTCLPDGALMLVEGG